MNKSKVEFCFSGESEPKFMDVDGIGQTVDAYLLLQDTDPVMVLPTHAIKYIKIDWAEEDVKEHSFVLHDFSPRGEGH